MEMPIKKKNVVDVKPIEQPVIEAKSEPNPSPAQTDGVEGKKVELIDDSSIIGANRDVILQMIQRKYPNKAIAWPDKKSITFRHLGWKMLQLTNGGSDVKEVSAIEEAERTTDTVLCWRDKRVDEIQRSEDENRRKLFNNFSRQEEDPHHMAKAINSSMRIDGVRAVAD